MQDDSDKMLAFELEQMAQGGPLAFNKATILEAIDRLAALQAKLDAVTKDARWLLDLIDENEGRTAYSLRAQHTMTDIERRFTDQGRAGEAT